GRPAPRLGHRGSARRDRADEGARSAAATRRGAPGSPATSPWTGIAAKQRRRRRWETAAAAAAAAGTAGTTSTRSGPSYIARTRSAPFLPLDGTSATRESRRRWSRV
ncbi:unnamed protein product, partial [Scytosiphon promiscuus]